MRDTADEDPTDENTLVFHLQMKHEGNSKKKSKSGKPIPKTLEGVLRLTNSAYQLSSPAHGSALPRYGFPRGFSPSGRVSLMNAICGLGVGLWMRPLLSRI